MQRGKKCSPQRKYWLFFGVQFLCPQCIILATPNSIFGYAPDVWICICLTYTIVKNSVKEIQIVNLSSLMRHSARHYTFICFYLDALTSYNILNSTCIYIIHTFTLFSIHWLAIFPLPVHYVKYDVIRLRPARHASMLVSKEVIICPYGNFLWKNLAYCYWLILALQTCNSKLCLFFFVPGMYTRRCGWRRRYETEIETRATGNSRFKNAKFPPAKEKIPENSRSVKCLILHALT